MLSLSRGWSYRIRVPQQKGDNHGGIREHRRPWEWGWRSRAWRSEETECIGPDKGECMMICKALSIGSSTPKDNQREAIFHTRCTIDDKVCSLYCDGGSCTNVASQVLIDKLQLSTSPHPHPYMVQWLNQGKGVQIARRVFLSFSIGKTYKEELWCDVIPMDACHILLWRPWLFDRRVIYDGYANTYSFNKDGYKITLVPDPKSSPRKPHSSLTIINTPNSYVPKKSRVSSTPILSSLRTNFAESGENVGASPSSLHHPYEPPFKDQPYSSLVTRIHMFYFSSCLCLVVFYYFM